MLNVFAVMFGSKPQHFKVALLLLREAFLLRKIKYPALIVSLFLVFAVTGCGSSDRSDNSGGNRIIGGYSYGGPGYFSLSWEAPTKNENGTPYNDPAGYKVYYGSSSGNYTNTVDVSHSLCQDFGSGIECSIVIDGLKEGTYYCAVTAYDTSANESDYSAEVIKETEL